MIKAIVFDCFGVIIADALEVLRAEATAKDPQVGREVSDAIRAHNKGMLEADAWLSQLSELLGLTIGELHAKIDDGEVKDGRILGYIRELRGRGHYKTALLSNIGSAGLERRFTSQELADHFDAVVVSGEIGFAKPEPQAYEITADRLGVRLDECMFTDDRELFCEAARAVGMQAISYRSFEQFQTDLEAVLTLHR